MPRNPGDCYPHMQLQLSCIDWAVRIFRCRCCLRATCKDMGAAAHFTALDASQCHSELTQHVATRCSCAAQVQQAFTWGACSTMWCAHPACHMSGHHLPGNSAALRALHSHVLFILLLLLS
jgi:hypothetical protein